MPSSPLSKTFLSITGGQLRCASPGNAGWTVERPQTGLGLFCLAADPRRTQVVYAGTAHEGVMRSTDGGQTWQPRGLAGITVKSLAVSPSSPGTIYAGGKPASIFVSHNGGETWDEIESFHRVRAWWWRSPAEADLGAYVQGLALSPDNPDLIVVGIEAGAVVRSADGGKTWQGHRPGALRDCHGLTFNGTNGQWVYEAGGTGAGVAVSRDGGLNWQQPRDGLDRHYGWAVAADPARPEIWYASLSTGMASWTLPIPAAHVDGKANAYIFRKVGGAPWQKLGGGLPQPLPYMAYALLTDPAAPGHLVAGLSNGDVWHSADHGDTWSKLPFNLGGIHRTLIMI